MHAEFDQLVVTAYGQSARPGIIKARDVARLLNSIDKVNRITYACMKYGDPKKRLTPVDSFRATPIFTTSREGSFEIELLVPVLIQQLHLFQDVPLNSVAKIWIDTIKYVLSKLSADTQPKSTSIVYNVENNYAPIYTQVAHGGNTSIKDLARAIRPSEIDRIDFKLNGKADLDPLVLDEANRDLLTNSKLIVGADESIVGKLIKFDIRRLIGIVETLDMTCFHCEFVFENADQIKHDMGETRRFRGRPQFIESIGRQSIQKYIVLSVEQIE